MYHFQLFDFNSGNILETFGTEREALRAAVGLANVNTPEAMAEVGLIVHSDAARETTLTLLAEGEELIAHARAVLAAELQLA
jgi:hypothetical protein